jgi:hypothetical protein
MSQLQQSIMSGVGLMSFEEYIPSIATTSSGPLIIMISESITHNPDKLIMRLC